MSASETASFTDPVFLATYGLNRGLILDYFLHPLNPFRIKHKSSNDILVSQQISIGFIMHNGIGMRPGPLSLTQAEDEFSSSLSRLVGHQYELLPVDDPEALTSMNSPLFTIRHVYRPSETKVVPLGIYYVLEGVIYKSPCARSLMKANVARTTQGLMEACDVLKHCARYSPRTGYYWDFEGLKKLMKSNSIIVANANAKNSSDANITDITAKGEMGECHLGVEKKETETIQEILDDFKARSKLATSARRILDNRPAGERSEGEEEGIRAKEKMNSILMRLKGSINTTS
eukprot:scaffold6860_cov297-Chaetoceros_neogracile.AAC.11